MPGSNLQELAATVSSKGQVVIPADVRRRLGLVQGSVLRFEISEDGSVRLRAAPAPVQRLKGRLTPPAGAAVSLDDMDAAIRQRRTTLARDAMPGTDAPAPDAP